MHTVEYGAYFTGLVILSVANFQWDNLFTGWFVLAAAFAVFMIDEAI